MAKDVQDTVRDAVSRAIESLGSDGRGGRSSGGLSGMRGLAAGAGAAALVPVAVKAARGGLGSVISAPVKAAGGLSGKFGDQVGSGVGDKVSAKVDEAGGPGGILKDTLTDALPFGGGGGGGGKGGAPGVGKGRRMPVQQSVDIGAPLETVYNQWTQFEDWPNFMHRVTRVSQEDDATLSFAAKIWGKTKEFTATIETQRPDQRIKWRVSQGLTHQGVVTFHELGPNLTRVLLGMDVEPGGLLEKAARGMRHVKRAARADLHRFKAFVEMNEQETGAWRGVIEDGEVVEEHDPEYDADREYADIEELTAENDDQDDEGEDEDEGDDESGADEVTAEEDDEAEGSESEDEGSEDEEDEEDEGPAPPRRRASSGNRASGGSSRRAAGNRSRSRGPSNGSSGTRRSGTRSQRS